MRMNSRSYGRPNTNGRRRRVTAGEDMGGARVAPEAKELLFEAEDVAELVAEVTGEPVDVTTEEDGAVTFGIGDENYTVEAEGTEEVLESRRLPRRSRVAAATQRGSDRRGTTVRKYPSGRR